MAARNPNPDYITAEMWWLWLELERVIPGVRLGGIYANKSGYHNTVNANLARWPGNYSVRYAIDRSNPRTKARAIDLTMNSTWMRTITRRLLDGAARQDPRMRCVREFYGSLDGRTVVGRIKNGPDEEFRPESSDSSHTWHEHLGLHTPFVDDMEAMRGLLSLLSGEDSDDYMEGTMSILGLRRGDSGADNTELRHRILKLQYDLDNAGFDPGEKDGEYGGNTAAAVLACRKSMGSSATDGDWITGAAANQIGRALIRAEARKVAPPAVPPGSATDAQVAAAVAAYLREHPPAPGKTPTRVTIDLPPVTGTVTATQ